MRRYHFLALSTLVLLATLAGLRTVELRQPEIVYADQRRVPSRGGRDYVAGLDRALAGTGLAGLGQAFYGAEKAYGVNGVISHPGGSLPAEVIEMIERGVLR